MDEKGKVILSIEQKEDDTYTVYKNKTYSYYKHDSTNPVEPYVYLMKPDYFQLAFECIEKNQTLYKVIINKKDNLFGYVLQNDKRFKFVSVEKFIANHSFDFDRAKNPLKAEPNESSKTIENPLTKKFKIYNNA